MQHPRTRAERRHARETWRNHRRKIIVTRYTHRNEDPASHGGWLKGGKQYAACGNRCSHSILDRFEERKQLKTLRRQSIAELADIP